MRRETKSIEYYISWATNAIRNRDESLRTLEFAVRERNMEAIKHFLKEGENPNTLNTYDATAFNIAVYGATHGLYTRTSLFDSPFPPKLEKLDQGFVEVIIELLKTTPIDAQILLPRRSGMSNSEPNILKFFAENIEEICTLKPNGLELALFNLSKSLEGLSKLQSQIESMSQSNQLDQIRFTMLKPKIDAAIPIAKDLKEKLKDHIPQEIGCISQFIDDIDMFCLKLAQQEINESISEDQDLMDIDITEDTINKETINTIVGEIDDLSDQV